jgi:ParB-like nuclease domain
VKTNEATEENANSKATVKPSDAADWTWADPKSLKVNPKFHRMIPLQARGELMALEESIKQDGCRDPLLVWKGRMTVLDGHTRRELCIKHKKQVKIREIELADEKAAIEFILQIQRQRRNLTREAMSYFRGVEYNETKGTRGGKRPKGQSDPLPSRAKLVADKYGVSEKTVKRDAIFAGAIDKIVEVYGDPDVQRTLLSADVRLTHGLARLLSKKPAATLKSSVKQLIEKGELRRAKDQKATAAPKEVAEAVVSRLKAQGDAHARAVLQQMARLLGMEVGKRKEP